MEKKLAVLHLEDNLNDAELIHSKLVEADIDAEFTVVETGESFVQELEKRDFDLVISDFSLPSFNGKKALEVVRSLRPETPFIFVSGTIGEDAAIESLVLGATDYVLKTKLSRLVPAIRRALQERKATTERKRAEEALKTSEKRLTLALKATQTGVWEWDIPTNRVFWSSECYQLFGVQESVLTFEDFAKLVHPEDTVYVSTVVDQVLSQGQKSFSLEFRVLRDGREVIWLSDQGNVEFDETGKPTKVIGMIHDITESKRAEHALRESEEKYRNLVDNAMVGVYTSNLRGDLLYVNKAFSTMLEYDSPLEMRARSASELYKNPEDRKRLLEHLQTHGLVAEFETEMLTKTGGLRNVIISSRLDKDSMSGMILDMTERKRAEEMLHKNERQLEEAQRIGHIGSWEWDAATDTPTWSKELCSILEVDPTKPAPSVAEQDKIYTTESMKRMRSAIEQAMTGTPYEIELEHVREDGTRKWLLARGEPRFDSNGRIVGLRGTALDITERKRAEEALRESGERFRQLTENIREVFWLTDTVKNTMLYISPSYESIWGRSGESLYSSPMNWLEAIHREDRERVYQAAMTKQSAGTYDEEYRIIRPDGTIRWIRDRAFPVRNAGGEIYRIAGVAENITERKQAEDVKKSLEAQLQQAQKLESLGILAGGIAHDFNNILGILMGHVSLLDRVKNDPELHKTSLDAIDTALKRGTGLVRQLLTFARKSDTVFGSVFINDIVKELLRLLQETFPKTIEIVTSLDPHLLPIVGDGGQIHQVLLNLCVNARDAMPAGGRVRIATNVVEAPAVRQRFPNASSEKYIEIEVRDSGMGMDDATKTRVFEPFFTTKESGKGTGLGLAVVFGVVQTHKGYIDVESEIGKGSAFRIYLPVELAHNSSTNNKKGIFEESVGGNETILFVEDEALLYETSRMALVSKGYRVLYAKDGLMAIDEFRKHFKEIQLVLTDMDLPKLGGARLVKALLEINPKIKIIFASGYIEPEVKSEVLKAGAKAFLAKPYDHVAMLATVREVLDADDRKER